MRTLNLFRIRKDKVKQEIMIAAIITIIIASMNMIQGIFNFSFGDLGLFAFLDFILLSLLAIGVLFRKNFAIVTVTILWTLGMIFGLIKTTMISFNFTTMIFYLSFAMSILWLLLRGCKATFIYNKHIKRKKV